jgi:hypothetical protein
VYSSIEIFLRSSLSGTDDAFVCINNAFPFKVNRCVCVCVFNQVLDHLVLPFQSIIFKRETFIKFMY